MLAVDELIGLAKQQPTQLATDYEQQFAMLWDVSSA